MLTGSRRILEKGHLAGQEQGPLERGGGHLGFYGEPALANDLVDARNKFRL